MDIKKYATIGNIMKAMAFIVLLFLFIRFTQSIRRMAKERPYVVKGPKDARIPLTISRGKLMGSRLGNEVSFSLWINVKDWGYNYSKPKHLFHLGDKEANSVCPGVWLYPKQNNLMIRCDTLNRVTNTNVTKSGKTCQNWLAQYPHKHNSVKRYTSEQLLNEGLGDHNYCRTVGEKFTWCHTTDPKTRWEKCKPKDHRIPDSMNPNFTPDFDPTRECDLKDIPVQRWVHLVIVVINRTIDVYMNGKLRRSCTLENVPRFNKGDLYINQDGGFNGQVSDFLYSNKGLSANEIESLYLSGWKKFTFYDKFARIIPKMDTGLGLGNGGGVPAENVKSVR